ncbi:hypothetical protein [Azospirillum halopraeferens]|uniref:hypothetical protein n=1 Tax=Azospirillum halopraeferens TaxID=34010 RepID=UPI00146F9F04|nr:hypothetical protein [Azospirillum halopraeferens]
MARQTSRKKYEQCNLWIPPEHKAAFRQAAERVRRGEPAWLPSPTDAEGGVSAEVFSELRRISDTLEQLRTEFDTLSGVRSRSSGRRSPPRPPLAQPTLFDL